MHVSLHSLCQHSTHCRVILVCRVVSDCTKSPRLVTQSNHDILDREEGCVGFNSHAVLVRARGTSWDRVVRRISLVSIYLGPPSVGYYAAGLCVASRWESAPSGNPTNNFQSLQKPTECFTAASTRQLLDNVPLEFKTTKITKENQCF